MGCGRLYRCAINVSYEKSYVIKSQIHDPGTPTHMEKLWGENLDEFCKAMDDEIQSLIRRDTWEIFQGIQFLIKMCFQENSLLSVRGNLIGQS